MSKRAFSTTRMLTFAALMAALSTVIGIFCKNFLNFGNGMFRITFESMPIILAGIVCGPIVGGLVGIASDLISYLLSAQTYAPNLIVTLGACMIGVTSGIVARFIIRKRGILQVLFAELFSHLIGSLIIKSIGLYQFYELGVLWRIPVYIIIIAIESLLLLLLFHSKFFRRALPDFDHRKYK